MPSRMTKNWRSGAPNMPESLYKPSSKRFRPKVPLDRRKRTARACTSCRLRKRRCNPGPSDKCQICTRNNLSCVFESVHDDSGESEYRYVQLGVASPAAIHSDAPTFSVNHDDVVKQFNKAFPAVGFQAHHSALLFEIFTELGQGSTEWPPKKGCGCARHAESPGRNEAVPSPSSALVSSKADKQTAGMTSRDQIRDYFG